MRKIFSYPVSFLRSNVNTSRANRSWSATSIRSRSPRGILRSCFLHCSILTLQFSDFFDHFFERDTFCFSSICKIHYRLPLLFWHLRIHLHDDKGRFRATDDSERFTLFDAIGDLGKILPEFFNGDVLGHRVILKSNLSVHLRGNLSKEQLRVWTYVQLTTPNPSFSVKGCFHSLSTLMPLNSRNFWINSSSPIGVV